MNFSQNKVRDRVLYECLNYISKNRGITIDSDFLKNMFIKLGYNAHFVDIYFPDGYFPLIREILLTQNSKAYSTILKDKADLKSFSKSISLFIFYKLELYGEYGFAFENVYKSLSRAKMLHAKYKILSEDVCQMLSFVDPDAGMFSKRSKTLTISYVQNKCIHHFISGHRGKSLKKMIDMEIFNFLSRILYFKSKSKSFQGYCKKVTSKLVSILSSTTSSGKKKR